MLTGDVMNADENSLRGVRIEERTTIGSLPMGDRVIIEQLSSEQVSEGGIIIPDQSQEKPTLGVIVAIGEGKLVESGGYRIACPFQLGHVVMFGKYAGTKFVKKFSKPNPLLTSWTDAQEDEGPLYHTYVEAAPDTCKCGGRENEKEHVPATVTYQREFITMREDEILSVELDYIKAPTKATNVTNVTSVAEGMVL